MLLGRDITGKYVKLRSVSIEDADFIISIRNDKEINSYIHATSTDINQQIEWISSQRSREGDYYFVMCDINDNSPIGLLSVYNINQSDSIAEYGRWISHGNPLQNIEGVMLLLDYAFDDLLIDTLFMLTMEDNVKVKHFWKSFGAVEEGTIEKGGLLLSKSTVRKQEYIDKIRPRCKKLLKYRI